ncbi:hypothetical protein GCM10010832_21970 [Psychroflexus planctonicus]|uniref:Secretion system C-terminal sorting domain-containing protein n=1 Tax=Psychroflexus planctonicus TaxID=1526575 RepID=A0ABQ1SIT5_9FLAO|nr:hypothetical protein GCM10010832_21970 [Psychroflexus planctonicus]
MLTVFFAQSQDGVVDVNWGDLPFNELNFKGPNGNVSGSLDNNRVYAIAEQTDGKLIIGGGFFNYNTTVSPKIVRTFADGSIDNSFQSPLLDVYFTSVRNIILLQDGRILITGQFEYDCGLSSACLSSAMVLNSDGSINRDITEITSNLVYDSHLLPDGKILIAGSVYNQLGISNRGITRINNDGTLDTTFESYPSSNLVTFGDSDIRDIDLQSDGKIIVAGNFNFYNGTSVENVIRLLPDGTLDTSFSAPDFDDDVYCVSVLTDDSIYVGGPFDEIDSNTQRFLAKLSQNGTLDTSFQPEITSGYREIDDIQLLPNGKLIIAGNFTSVEFEPSEYIARLNADGSLDTSYFSGLAPDKRVREIFLRSNGKLIFGGDFNSYQKSGRNYIAQTNADGILDASFNPGFGANKIVERLVVQPDGKIIAVGQFQEFNNYTRFGIVRLFPDGTVDPSFDAGLTFAYRSASDVVVQDDGKLVVASSFLNSELADVNTTPAVVRLNANGTLDNSFANAFEDNTTVTSLAIQDDGKIITNRRTLNFSYRLNTDGTEDLTFVGPSFIDIKGIAIQPDGKIIFVGQFSSYLGNSSSDIVRLNPDGTYDSSFDIGSGSNNYLRTAVVKPNGKILVGGNASSFNGQNRGKIIQLNTDGSVDTTFEDTDLISEVWDIKLTPDDKILISGRIFSIDGHDTDGIARLLSDGSIDTSFSISEIDDDRIVSTMVVDEFGDLIFGGYFTNVNQLQRGYISRALNNDSDNDGVGLEFDADPNDPFICRDLDNDGCDDCSQTGPDGSGGDVNNDGDDLDGDGICDEGDDDIDGDGFTNQEEMDCGSDPYDASEDCDTLNVNRFKSEDFELFPNPAQEKITIKYTELIENIAIFDLKGHTLFKSKPYSKEVTINTQSISNGIYFVQIRTSRVAGTKKIIVKH